MKQFILSFILALFTCALYAQTNSNPEEDKVYDLLTVDEAPQFPGGSAAMLKYIKDSINPEFETAAMMQKELTGNLMGIAQMIVEKDGSLSNIQIGGGSYDVFNKEAERIVNSFPKFTPGKIKGEAVRVKYTIPIDFGTLLKK